MTQAFIVPAPKWISNSDTLKNHASVAIHPQLTKLLHPLQDRLLLHDRLYSVASPCTVVCDVAYCTASALHV